MSRSRRVLRTPRAVRRVLIVTGSTAAGAMLAGVTLMTPVNAAPRTHGVQQAGLDGARHTGQGGARQARPDGIRRARPHGIRGATPSAGPLATWRETPQDLPRGQVSSANWSGYAASGKAYTSVSANWVEPEGTCGFGNQYSSFWVGLDGYDSQSVEQIGSEFDCSGGTPAYYSWYEMYPAGPVNFSDTVQPGDRLTASVIYTGKDSFTLRLTDITRGWSRTVTKALAGAARSSAEVIAEVPCCTASGDIPQLADFGSVSFADAMVNGSAIGAANPTAMEITSADGMAEDTVSALGNGKDFSVIWEDSGDIGLP